MSTAVDNTLDQAWQRVRNARRIVVKIGSNLLTGSDGLKTAWIEARCAEIVTLIERGCEVVVVSSGAVAAGRPRMKMSGPPRTLAEKQAAAAAGQGVLMSQYDQAFSRSGRHAAQILLTRDDMADRRRYLNARDTLNTLLKFGLVPVVNENDTVVTAELRYGDNDTLAAMVACLVDADLLILLSDVDGLYSADPRHDNSACKVPIVSDVTAEIEALAGGVGSDVGTGGMVTKLKAGKKSARCGCSMVLVDGSYENPILRVTDHGPVGTLFEPLSGDCAITSRQRWIVNGLGGEGVLHLDKGATKALKKGNSLLSMGIIGFTGDFDRGDAVYCCGPDGRKFAKGMISYRWDHLAQILGHHSRDFEKLLGFQGNDEIIHRDNLVLLEGLSNDNQEEETTSHD
ncbi:MAG: glutamate 5-kinase [Magnetococcales bacterium]|nr:glutamate 5-kinase [Magnetococcales bacterium]